MNHFFLSLFFSIILFSCNKDISTQYVASKEYKDAIMYYGGFRHVNFKEGYEIENFNFLDSCRKNIFQKSLLEKEIKPCPLKITKNLKDLIFMVGGSSYDSIVKVEFIEEKVLNDSTSFVILKSENKNSKGYLAGNSEFMKILIIKSNNRLKSISKIYSHYADGFHSYEESILKLENDLYQVNDFFIDDWYPFNHELNAYSIFRITNDGYIEVLNEAEALPHKQKVLDNVNKLNSKN